METLPDSRNHDRHNSSLARLRQRIPLKDRQLILPIILFAVIGYMVGLTDNLFPGGDNARYLILAKSLLSGRGYRDIGVVAAPYHTLAPPGFPLLLALTLATFGMDIIVAKMLVGVFGVISIVVVYALFKRTYGIRYAAGIALLYGTAPLVFMYARRVYSDLPFVVVSLLALWAVERYVSARSLFNVWLFPACVALATSFYLRPVALALLLAATFWLFIRKRLAQGVLLFLLVVLLIAPWYYWVQRVSVDVAPGHFATFMSQGGLFELVRRVLINGISYAQLFTENVFYVATKGLEHLGLHGFTVAFSIIAVIAVNLLIVVGFIRVVRAGLALSEVYVGIYFTVLLSYSLVLDRFIIPVLPFIIHYCIQGLIVLTQKMAGQAHKRVRRIVINAFLFCVVLSNGFHMAARFYQERNFAVFSPEAAAHFDIARWAGVHLEATAVVATDYPDFFYVYAGRQAVDLSEDIVNDVDEGLVRFVIVDKNQATHVEGWLYPLGDYFDLLSRYCTHGSAFCLYEIVPFADKDTL